MRIRKLRLILLSPVILVVFMVWVIGAMMVGVCKDIANRFGVGDF